MNNKKQALASSKRTSYTANQKKPIAVAIIIIALAIAGYFGTANHSITELPDSYILADWEAAVHYINVGQGDSVLIQTTQGNVLIDGGDTGMGSRVVEYLRDAGISEIAFVVATHPHSDHIGGLIDVFSEFSVSTVIMPEVDNDTVTYERFLDALDNNDIPIRYPVIGDSFSIGEAVFTIIAPNSSGYRSLNDYSVSLRVTLGNTAFLFTGDAERRSEREMLVHYISSDVLYIGHHGSNTSTTQEFLDAVSPTVAVISVGDNAYGHPSGDVLNRLEDAGIIVYRTDIHGNIIIVTDGTDLSIRSQFNGVYDR